jgi:nicotinate-nucleotide adenylyltransferase
MREPMHETAAQAPSGGQRVAFFGGSFDPPHLGHLAVARAARAALGLDTVLFAPVGAQPLKLQRSTASFADRLDLTRLAIAGEPGFAVSLADAPKSSGAPNFTLETLLSLRAELPPDAELFCLMGADSFLGLRQWHRAAEIPFVAPLIVASRPNHWPVLRPELLLADLKDALPAGLTIEGVPGADEFRSGVEVRSYLLRNPAGRQTPFYLLPGLDVEISASQVRDQIRDELREQVHAAAGAPTSGHQLLPKAVFEAIRSRGLYR